MKIIFLVSIIVIVACAVVGCGKSSSVSITSDGNNYVNKVYGMAELDRILKKGMKKSEVQDLFGAPYVSLKDFFIYHVDFGAIERKRDIRVTGFSIEFQDDKVKSWNVILGSIQ